MKLIFTWFIGLTISLISCKKTNEPVSPPITDSFSVIVTNGYGTGKYKIGDTVHVWSKELSATQVFDTWTGSPQILNTDDWHAWFIMPSHNISLNAILKNVAPVTMVSEHIRGKDRLKPVYYYFPAGHKGFVYLLHGSGGSAQQLINSFEAQHIIKELLSDGFGVIITEAEEATTGVDANSDGKIRWSLTPADTLTNIDYANIRIITDTFYNRNITTRALPRFSAGISNGGAFAAALSYAYNHKAAISYCAPAAFTVALNSEIPLQFCMQRYDSHENVGPAGNAEALSNSQALLANGTCSRFLMNEHSPVYKERFSRRIDISNAVSVAIFNELKNTGRLDEGNFFIGTTATLATDIQASPLQYPVIRSLTLSQIVFILEQLNCCIAEHHLYSDFTKETLRFLNSQCL